MRPHWLERPSGLVRLALVAVVLIAALPTLLVVYLALRIAGAQEVQ